MLMVIAGHEGPWQQESLRLLQNDRYWGSCLRSVDYAGTVGTGYGGHLDMEVRHTRC